MRLLRVLFFFFFNDTATTEIYTVSDTLSLHDALPIWAGRRPGSPPRAARPPPPSTSRSEEHTSELQSPDTISYAVFCLKKKKPQIHPPLPPPILTHPPTHPDPHHT